MTTLLPHSIADARFTALDQVVAERVSNLPLIAVLVYVLSAVDASALPALAWQSGALGATWQAAPDEAAKREIIRRTLVRRRHRGTHFAVHDALDAAGIANFVRNAIVVPVRYNGQFRHAGVVRHAQPGDWNFWVVVTPEPDDATLDSIQAITREWQRTSLRAQFFWVATEELLEETTEYNHVA